MITSKKEHEKNGVLWKVSKNMIKKDESILVVPVEKLMEHMGEWQGLRTDSMNVFTECVREHGMFMLRSAAECDERYNDAKNDYKSETHKSLTFELIVTAKLPSTI